MVALGFTSQDNGPLLLIVERICKTRDCPYYPVSSTSAAILYALNQCAKAEELLKEFVLNTAKHLALLTINYLLYTDYKSPFIDVVTQVYKREKDAYETSAASKDFLGSLGLVPNNFEYR